MGGFSDEVMLGWGGFVGVMEYGGRQRGILGHLEKGVGRGRLAGKSHGMERARRCEEMAMFISNVWSKLWTGTLPGWRDDGSNRIEAGPASSPE